MILARTIGVINFTHSANQTQQMAYIFIAIDIQIAHYGCDSMSKNCHVLCCTV
jgi:ABC-type oligopeptide transport system ATPase subunit